MSDYYNTTNESGKKLKEYKSKAASGCDKILKYFKKVGKPMTPSDVHMNLFDESTPLTSTRRAISTLTNVHNKLRMTEDKKMGIYGRDEHYWELNV